MPHALCLCSLSSLSQLLHALSSARFLRVALPFFPAAEASSFVQQCAVPAACEAAPPIAAILLRCSTESAAKPLCSFPCAADGGESIGTGGMSWDGSCGRAFVKNGNFTCFSAPLPHGLNCL